MLAMLGAGLLFAFLSGVIESANVVAPVIATRALSPVQALLLVAGAAGLAPYLFGLGVARAFGAGVVRPDQVTPVIVLAAALSAILWRVLTWWWRLPSSSSHALVGGLMGAGLVGAGWSALNQAGLIKVLLALLISPAVGLAAGYAATGLLYWLVRGASPRVNEWFRRGEVITALALALSWGANDAQKAIGLLALGLAAGAPGPLLIPAWMVPAAMGCLMLGTLSAGGRLVRTLGMRFYRLRPVHGLAAQVAAASVVLGATAVAGPVSTTQVVSTAILGAGAAERINMVRWTIALDILLAWIFTVPATAALGAAFALGLRLLRLP
jgi:PiT family inorganic phosphate transporter